MSPRPGGRTSRCGEPEARQRLADAKAQLELAELADRTASAEELKAAASSAVLAGIAASDAACCKALGETNRSENHHDAVALVSHVSPGGADAAKRLRRLLSMKDEVQYGFSTIGATKLDQARRNARALVEFAESTLQR